MDIRSDRQKGLSYVELGKKYHMDPRTAKRYAESPQKPEYTLDEGFKVDHPAMLNLCASAISEEMAGSWQSMKQAPRLSVKCSG